MNAHNHNYTFTEKFHSLLNTYAPLQKISKNKLKIKDMHWITPAYGHLAYKNLYLLKTTTIQSLLD